MDNKKCHIFWPTLCLLLVTKDWQRAGYIDRRGVRQSRDQRRYSGLAGSHAAPNSQAQ